VIGTLLLTTFYSVPADSVGVVQRFGKYTRTEDPGLRFKFPFAMETVKLVPIRRQLKLEFGFGTEGASNPYQQADDPDAEKAMVTGDLNEALVEWVVQYRINDPKRYLFVVRDPEETLRAASETVMREVVGDRTVDEVITIGRQEMEVVTRAELQKVAEQYQLGMSIDLVQLKNVNPPRQVQASFDQVNQAQQEKQRSINIANGEYNKVVPRADGEAAKLLAEAQGYAQKRVNEAEGDATRFIAVFEQYRKAPEVTRQRLFLETMGEVLPKLGRKVIVDEKSQGVLPLLVILANLCFYAVSESEQVITTQFGRPVGEPKREAGIHFKIPFIQTVHRIDKRILEWDGRAVEMPTRDKLYVIVDTFGRWRIQDPLQYFTRLRDERSAQSRLEDIIGSELRNAVAKHDLIEIVRTSKDRKSAVETSPNEELAQYNQLLPIQLGRTAVEKQIVQNSAPKLKDFGIELIDVRLMRVNYNPRVSAKIYERMISEREQIAARFRAEGEGEAAKILGNKERDLRRIESEAYRQIQKVRGDADAKASEIFARAYGGTPEAAEFYGFLKTMETYQKSLGKDATLILSTDSDIFRFLKNATITNSIGSNGAVKPKPQ
jgi:membrane protease subunit HflC